MPELPEVETTRRGIEPWLRDRRIDAVHIHEPRLRWPVADEIPLLKGQSIVSVRRRGKYLLIDVPTGSALVHLGMSGSLRITQREEPLRKHDHVELVFGTSHVLRFHDPRRFGCWLWQAANSAEHKLLAHLGPEPLGNAFTSDYLFEATRGRNIAIKNLIMNSQVVVGVGNIYASESLFVAGIRPGKAARRIRRVDCEALVDAIRTVLSRSIEQGGTTLRDFVNSEGNPGYFQQSLFVYGREGEACRQCSTPIRQRIMGQRSTFYCPNCQS